MVKKQWIEQWCYLQPIGWVILSSPFHPWYFLLVLLSCWRYQLVETSLLPLLFFIQENEPLKVQALVFGSTIWWIELPYKLWIRGIGVVVLHWWNDVIWMLPWSFCLWYGSLYCSQVEWFYWFQACYFLGVLYIQMHDLSLESVLTKGMLQTILVGGFTMLLYVQQYSVRWRRISFGCIVMGNVLLFLPEIVWIFEFVLADVYCRGSIAGYWIGWLVVAIKGFPWLEKKFQLKQIIARKLYHCLTVAMFLPILYIDPAMLYLSFGIAFAGLMIAEYIRLLQLPPFGQWIDDFMKVYVDERDSGLFIKTHLYLLVGCALPLWLQWNQFSIFVVMSGIIVLGIGDASGAVVGSTIGTIHLFNTKKTLQGSIAMFGSIVLITICCCSLSSYPFLLFLWCVCSTTLLEASTTQIDNLVLPLYYCCFCALVDKVN